MCNYITSNCTERLTSDVWIINKDSLIFSRFNISRQSFGFSQIQNWINDRPLQTCWQNWVPCKGLKVQLLLRWKRALTWPHLDQFWCSRDLCFFKEQLMVIFGKMHSCQPYLWTNFWPLSVELFFMLVLLWRTSFLDTS